MSTLETWDPENTPPSYPQLSLVEGGEQASTLERQVTRATELVTLFNEVQAAIAELPREAVIAAAEKAIILHHEESAANGSNTVESRRLGQNKDNILRLLSPEELSAAMFKAFDQEHPKEAA